MTRKTRTTKPIIETDLGLERECSDCNESYPLDADFFYRDGKDKNGNQKFTTMCRDCYIQQYRGGSWVGWAAKRRHKEADQ